MHANVGSPMTCTDKFPTMALQLHLYSLQRNSPQCMVSNRKRKKQWDGRNAYGKGMHAEQKKNASRPRLLLVYVWNRFGRHAGAFTGTVSNPSVSFFLSDNGVGVGACNDVGAGPAPATACFATRSRHPPDAPPILGGPDADAGVAAAGAGLCVRAGAAAGTPRRHALPLSTVDVVRA